MRDEELREAFAAWNRPLREDTVTPPVSVIVRRARRRTMRIAGSSLAVIGVVGAAVAIALASAAGSAGHGHKQPQPPVGKARPEGVRLTEPYAVLLQVPPRSPVVVNMRTGKTLGRVRLPGQRPTVWWAAAAADDRTFVLAVSSGAQRDQFYLLRLGHNGEPRKPTLLRVTLPAETQIYGMALTADGTKLAIAWQNPPVGPELMRLEVFSLVTGATRTWSSAEGGAVNVSWDGDHLLAFDWQDIVGQAHSGVRLLDTSAPGTNPLASRLLIPYSTGYAGLGLPSNPVVTPNGRAIFILMGAPGGLSAAIVKFSASTGKPLAVITKPESMNGTQHCGILEADRTGQVIAQCGTIQVSIDGNKVTRIKLPLVIRASMLGFANTFAW
jgi:hypothetical protein